LVIIVLTESTKPDSFAIIYFAFWSLVFTLLQIALKFFTQGENLFSFQVIQQLFEWLSLSPTLRSHIYIFAITFVGINVTFYLIAFFIYRRLTLFYPRFLKASGIVLFHLWVFLVINFINYHTLPDSITSWVFEPIYASPISYVTFSLLTAALLIISIFSILDLIITQLKKQQSRNIAIVTSSSIFIILSATYFISDGHSNSRFLHDKPNIILIGIDSLRPDIIDQNLTPTLNDFASNALYFSNAYTTLGRTFPAWMSILTGKYPVHHSARFNLTHINNDILLNSLAYDLKKDGYTTFYASDEKRFSNIDHSFGFDYLGGPESGLDDFIISSVSDFPLINFIRESPLGHFLLPHSYDNRAIDTIYNPDHFDNTLNIQLKELPDRPAFISVHFCLPHWPYNWSGSRDYKMIEPSIHQKGIPQNYLKAVNRADDQVKDFLNQLKENDLLKNAIVFIFSDHGEGFAKGEKIINYSTKGDEIISGNQLGHGGSVDNPDDSKILLMLRRYGEDKTTPSLLSQPASLIDIRPTILDLLSLKTKDKIDGVSLIRLNKKESLKRPIYFETGIRIHIESLGKIDKAKILNSNIHSYDLSSNDSKLTLKESMLPGLMRQKERAVLYGTDYLIQKYKSYNNGKTINYFFLTNSKYSDSTYLKRSLCNHFSKDIDFYENACNQ
jgi:arylsulfatase A-like enzyme